MNAEDLNTMLTKSTIGRNGGKGKVRKFRFANEVIGKKVKQRQGKKDKRDFCVEL